VTGPADVESLVRDFRGLAGKRLCEYCDGWGVRVYPTTATWRGGIGGATPANDVCNRCWGSGDADRAWPPHKGERAPRDDGGLLSLRVSLLRFADEVETLAYHPRIGIVRKIAPTLAERMRALAAKEPARDR
jgi:hypothetical protein